MSTKNSKRILSVKLIHEVDTDPDTSYLGEYSDKATSEYSIDRKHSLDCQINTHANDEAIEKLERAVEWLNDARLDSTPNFDAIEEAQTILLDKQDELAECDCDERGDMNRNEYRYFNPSFNYVDKDGRPQDNLTPAEIRDYTKQDYERMESLNSGIWCYMGITAKAEVQLTGPLCQTILSGGLRGIESDSDASYIAEIDKEQLADLKSELRAIGFSTRAISKAFQNVERQDN